MINETKTITCINKCVDAMTQATDKATSYNLIKEEYVLPFFIIFIVILVVIFFIQNIIFIGMGGTKKKKGKNIFFWSIILTNIITIVSLVFIYYGYNILFSLNL